jgi:hypothetical protein
MNEMIAPLPKRATSKKKKAQPSSSKKRVSAAMPQLTGLQKGKKSPSRNIKSVSATITSDSTKNEIPLHGYQLSFAKELTQV